MDVVIRMLGILRELSCVPSPKGPLIEYTQIYLRRKLLEIFPYATIKIVPWEI